MANVLLDDYRALRACFLYEFLQGHKAADAHRNICKVVGKGALQYEVVKFWFRRFKSGDYTLENRKPKPTRRRVDSDDDDEQELTDAPSATVSVVKEEVLPIVQSCDSISIPAAASGNNCAEYPTKDDAMEVEAAPSLLVRENDGTQNPTPSQILIADDVKPVTLKELSESAAVKALKYSVDVTALFGAHIAIWESNLMSASEDASRSIHIILMAHDNRYATTRESWISIFPSADKEKPRSRRQCHINVSGQLFQGVVEASQRGIHPVVKYPIPGGELCYAFEHMRKTKQGLVICRCTACRKKGITTSIAVQNGCDFIGDPVLLPHVCKPLKNAKDKVTRIVYQSCQAIAKEPQFADAKPNQLWHSIAQFIDENAPDDEVQREMMLKHFYRDGYRSRRTTIARAAAKLRRIKMGKTADSRGKKSSEDADVKD